MFSEGVCGKVGIFHNGKNPIEVFFPSRGRHQLCLAFNQEKALVGAFSVITNLRMELFQALVEMVAVVMVRGWDGDEDNHCCAAVVMDISQHLVSVIAARPGSGLLSGCQLTSGVWCLAGA